MDYFVSKKHSENIPPLSGCITQKITNGQYFRVNKLSRNLSSSKKIKIPPPYFQPKEPKVPLSNRLAVPTPIYPYMRVSRPLNPSMPAPLLSTNTIEPRTTKPHAVIRPRRVPELTRGSKEFDMDSIIFSIVQSIGCSNASTPQLLNASTLKPVLLPLSDPFFSSSTISSIRIESSRILSLTHRQISPSKRRYILARLARLLKYLARFHPRISLLDLPDRPYSRPGSRLLFEAAKLDKTKAIFSRLKADFPIVLDHDDLGMTALHWAVNKAAKAAALLLIRSGAFVDAVDMLGRPPLFYALVEGDMECVVALLEGGASPWSTIRCDLAKACGGNDELRMLLRKYRFDDLMRRFVRKEKKDKASNFRKTKP